MKFMRSDEFRKRIGVSKKKLETSEKAGEIKPIRKGHLKYYTEEMVYDYFGIEYKEKAKDRKVIAYYRVSSNSQKDDLERQRKSLEDFSVNSGKIIDEYMSDIGSGINFKRKNFLKLIDMIENGEVSEVIVTYKDRLTRFAYDLIAHRAELNNCKITVINLQSTSPEEELIEDLMTIIHVFSSRLYGLRSWGNKLKKGISDVHKDSKS